MQKNTFKCKEFFNRYIVEETVYKEADNNELMPIKIYSRSTLGEKFNDELATSLLDKWSTKDINEFAQVIKSFLLERRAL